MYYLHQHKKESVILGCYVMPSAFYLQWKEVCGGIYGHYQKLN